MILLHFEELPSDQIKETVVTIGNFDGVHAGHQMLIQSAVADANANGFQSVVVTFHPHPYVFFHKNSTIRTICSRKYKEKLIRSLGVDALLTLRFNSGFATLDPEEYIQKILLEKLNAKIIWIGYDFSFGRDRTGNVRSLIEQGERYGIRTNVLSPQRQQGVVLSSTKIRELINRGKVKQAAALLNRKHLIRGTVIYGDAVGRTLGYPTINLNVKEGMVPGNGIYSGIARVNKKEYPAAIYIGTRPSFPDHSFRVEAYLLDFSGNLYANQVSLAFLRFIRKESTFKNISDLKSMIASDCESTVRDYSSYKKTVISEPIIW